jgi:hypothetical protein
MIQHIDRCFAFAQEKELGIEHMEDIILVTGCDLASSWTNVAFLRGEVNAEASFGEKVSRGTDESTNITFSAGYTAGAVLLHGPEGKVCCLDACKFQWICDDSDMTCDH